MVKPDLCLMTRLSATRGRAGAVGHAIQGYCDKLSAYAQRRNPVQLMADNIAAMPAQGSEKAG
ncbi:hypothetical protein [Ferrimonas pelagia]|uniref:Transposase n=1 Tax=Ferrimonas pelagia TaxID=1177826 RepID=A0ABP9FM89_9GAMM